MRNYTSREYASEIAWRVREALIRSYGLNVKGFIYNIDSYPLQTGTLSYGDRSFIKVGPHDTNSWNFVTRVVSVNFNNGEIETAAVHMIEVLLGFPMNVKDNQVIVRLGGTDINLPIAGEVPVRQILNNILCARGVNRDLANRNILHGSHISALDTDWYWNTATQVPITTVSRFGVEREFSKREISYICPQLEDRMKYADFRVYSPDPRYNREVELRDQAREIELMTIPQDDAWFEVAEE